MKGSGKSRTIRLICSLSKDGSVMASPTEAVLFRTTGTLGIDEFEGVGGKDKSHIRELLNAGYKRGIKVVRMKKKITLEGEEQVPEEFYPFRPIVMANIWGMEQVLADRCIYQVLEKSDDNYITRLPEDFETNKNIINIVKNLNQCSLCSVVTLKNIDTTWKSYLFNRYKSTLSTTNTYTTLTTLTTLNNTNNNKLINKDQLEKIELEEMFNVIHDSNIKGRNLELFMPLFLISYIVGDDIFKKTIEIAKNIANEKKQEEEVENIDILLYEFVSEFPNDLRFYSVNDLTLKFREFSDRTDDWINVKWFGKALKRLQLVSNKKRMGRGIQVMLNTKKAQEKIKMFR